MNKINRPVFPDLNALRNLSLNKAVKSFPKLQRLVPVVERGYTAYVNSGGNGLNMRRVFIDRARASFLREHYKRPPADLKYIKTMRGDSGHLCCPMCGSMHSGTLDHVLPKDQFPAFAVYSANLVPACLCNSKRGNVAFNAVGERVLHPYFDHCLSQRLVAAKFSNLGPVPKVDIEVLLAIGHPDRANVDFHVQTILEKTAVKRYLGNRWSAFWRNPAIVVRALERNPASHAELVLWLEKERDMLDDLHQGKNNWNSMFVSGLLDGGVAVWLFNMLTFAGRLAGGPLK